jgi:hypothetical protein
MCSYFRGESCPLGTTQNDELQSPCKNRYAFFLASLYPRDGNGFRWRAEKAGNQFLCGSGLVAPFVPARGRHSLARRNLGAPKTKADESTVVRAREAQRSGFRLQVFCGRAQRGTSLAQTRNNLEMTIFRRRKIGFRSLAGRPWDARSHFRGKAVLWERRRMTKCSLL